MKLSLKEISKIIGASLEGDRSKEIVGINTLEDATSEQISYAVSKKYLESLTNTNAGAVIVDSSLKKYCSTDTLMVEDTYLAFAKLTHHFKKYQSKISINDIQLNLDKISSIEGVLVEPGCFIGKEVIIGKNTTIEANCVIEDGVHIGEDSHIFANVVFKKTAKSARIVLFLLVQ